jgi:CBS domain-containing protein
MIPAKIVMCKRTAVLKDSSVREVVQKMMTHGCPGLPVVNNDAEVIGMVKMCDILKVAREMGKDIDKVQVDKIMTEAPVTADPEQSVDEIANIMADNNAAVVPIVKGKRLVGLVSAREIVDALVDPHLLGPFDED